MEDNLVRINKFLASKGILARRKIAEYLKVNTVTVNGNRITEPGIKINPGRDEVLINGKEIISGKAKIYIIVNKPKGIISTASDEHGRKNVIDLVKSNERLFPVGRLDADSKGLVLLTNDGELANRLIHPRYHIPKTYICLISGKVSADRIEKIRHGINLNSFRTAPADAKIIEEKTNRTVLEITLFEGKNHQIRKMCAVLRLSLIELKRIAMGPIQIGDLKSGEYRELTRAEVLLLKSGPQH